MAIPLAVPIEPAETVRPDDLALVGEVAALLDIGHIWDSLDQALEHLRTRTGADAAELFLADPHRTQMFLVSHEGTDASAFCARERFHAGEGFPGMVLSTGSAVATTSLSDDQEFVRRRVKALSYQTVVAVPVSENGSTGACLLLAWKLHHGDLERILGLLALTARPIGAAVEAARSRVRIFEMQRHVLSSGHVGSAASAGLALFRPPSVWHEAWSQDGAFALTVRGVSDNGGVVGTPVSTMLKTTPAVCDAGCPAERTGQVQIMGGRAGWPSTCRSCRCSANARYCIPLGEQAHVWGVASVRFPGAAPVPLVRHLPAALWATEDLAPRKPGSTVAFLPFAGASSARLSVQCMGGFSVTLGDGEPHEASFGRAKARELLALLVAAGGRPRNGRHLSAELWPEATEQQAANRFHVTLSALRGAIEPGDAPAWTFVKRTGSSYFLDPSASVQVDLWRFQEIARALLLTSGNMPAAELDALLSEITALHVDDPFGGEFRGAWVDEMSRQCTDTMRQVERRFMA